MIRVLHVVENFNGQAVESWLTRLVAFEGFDSNKLRFDFFLIGTGQGWDGGTVVDKGFEVHLGNPGGASIPQMAKALRRITNAGAYDIVHIHQDVMGGIFAAALLGAHTKIVTQVHNCWQRLPVGGHLKEKILTVVAKALTVKLSDAIVGVSKPALAKMLGTSIRRSRIDRVIYCSGKALGHPHCNVNQANARSLLRKDYGFPDASKILLFLGRLDSYKNPAFTIQVLQELIKKGDKDCCLIIAGTGGLQDELSDAIKDQKLESRVRIVGWIDDPANLLLAADLLLMPSQEWCGEGLGLAAVEAQGYGMPVLCSMSIPDEAAIIPSLFRRVSLKRGTSEWATAATQLLRVGRVDIAVARAIHADSFFTDSASLKALCTLYREVLGN